MSTILSSMREMIPEEREEREEGEQDMDRRKSDEEKWRGMFEATKSTEVSTVEVQKIERKQDGRNMPVLFNLQNSKHEKRSAEKCQEPEVSNHILATICINCKRHDPLRKNQTHITDEITEGENMEAKKAGTLRTANCCRAEEPTTDIAAI